MKTKHYGTPLHNRWSLEWLAAFAAAWSCDNPAAVASKRVGGFGVYAARERRTRTANRRHAQRVRRHWSKVRPPRGTFSGPAVGRIFDIVSGRSRSRGRATRRAFRFDRMEHPFFGGTPRRPR